MTSNFFDTLTVKEEFGVEDVSDAELYEAERHILFRYTDPHRTSQTGIGFFNVGYSVNTYNIYLQGYKGTINNPEIVEMEDDLVFAIRKTIVNYLNFDFSKKDVDSLSEGNRSVSYSSTSTDTSKIYKLLDYYDTKPPMTFL